jgi:succinoglycan biosynthesis protein ExoA
MSGTGGDRVDVSVLTPVLNEEGNIGAVASAMLGQRFDGTIEFIFVDGRSEDGTAHKLRELAAADSRVQVLDNPRRSTPIALNIGLRAARGEYIARMDAHTHYPPEYIARGVERLRRGGADHVSGPQLARGAGAWSRRVALALGSRLGTGEASFRHLSQGEIDVDTGFTGIWRRSTLEEQGGWDEEWHNDQDKELAARIRKAGGRIVCVPEMAADYIPRDSLRQLARQYWRYGFYRAKTSGRHPESMRPSHVLAPGLVIVMGLAPLRGRLGRLTRAAVMLYALVVASVSAGVARRGQRGDAAALPLVFLTMHVSFGLGFVAGSLRFGPPLPALARLLRRGSA